MGHLLDNKEMLEAILGTIDEGIHVVDARGITIYYNPIAAKHDGINGRKHLANMS